MVILIHSYVGNCPSGGTIGDQLYDGNHHPVVPSLKEIAPDGSGIEEGA